MNEENLNGEELDVTRNIMPEPTGSLARCRKWFEAAVDDTKKRN